MRRIFSIFLVFVMLVSSGGITVARHYCGGMLVKTGIRFAGGKLPGCGMERDQETSCANLPLSFQRNCCDTQAQTLRIADPFNTLTIDVQPQVQFPIACAPTFFQSFIAEVADFADYLHYRPPLPVRDIPVLIRSFLI